MFYKSILISIVVFLFIFASCEKLGERKWPVTITNTTQQTIMYYTGFGGDWGIYPDTILPQQKPQFIISIKPNSYRINNWSFPYEKVFSQLPTDTLSFYFFHPDTLSKYSWEEVRAGYKVRRKDYSYEQLKSADWKVYYP